MRQPLAYVVSPQRWDDIHVSKHHYAIALADRGWRVVFIDPPTSLGKPGQIQLFETEVPRVSRLRYQTFFPYWLKFHARSAFDFLMTYQARRLVGAAGQPDLVWDFDNAYQFRDLRPFGAKLALFHLVDDVGPRGLGDKKADHFFYLHDSFCLNAGREALPSHQIGHGLGQIHAEMARAAVERPQEQRAPHIGLVGNLAAPWIDWSSVAEMVRRHPEARFTFWGPLPKVDLELPLRALLANPSVQFPGATSSQRIVEQARGVDVWLLPFRTEKLLGGPLNSHKVLEYLATGRVVVMNWLEAYASNPLVCHTARNQEQALPDLLDATLASLDVVNAPEMMARRRTFALERSYSAHLDRIEEITGLEAIMSDRHAA